MVFPYMFLFQQIFNPLRICHRHNQTAKYVHETATPAQTMAVSEEVPVCVSLHYWTGIGPPSHRVSRQQAQIQLFEVSRYSSLVRWHPLIFHHIGEAYSTRGFMVTRFPNQDRCEPPLSTNVDGFWGSLISSTRR